VNEDAQIHTIEGFAAAALMTMTALLVTESTVIITPQSELSLDVQLQEIASDALAVLDSAPDIAIEWNLSESVAAWDPTSEATPDGSNNLEVLDSELEELLPSLVYNVDLAYVENGDLTVRHAIIHGTPTEDSVVARRLVTLSNETVEAAGGNWSISKNEIRVVEVRLIAWQV